MWATDRWGSSWVITCLPLWDKALVKWTVESVGSQSWTQLSDFHFQSSFNWRVGLCYGEHTGHILQCYISFSLPGIRGICLHSSQWRSVGVLALKVRESVWTSVNSWPHDFLTLKLVHICLPASHQNYHLNVLQNLWLQWLLLQGSWFDSFTVTCLLRFWDVHLPCNLNNIP